MRPKHVDHPLPAAFQPDAVQLTVAAGFNIQRHPLQRRPVVRVGLHAGVDQPPAARVTFDPNRSGNEALHQIALRWADIGFVNGDAVFTQLLFQAHQLAMSATIEAKDRLAMKVF